MKKWSLIALLALSVWTFQSCNNAADNDAVENANEANEEKRDSADVRDTTNTAGTASTTPVTEDDSKFLVKAASGGMMEVELGNLAQQKAQNAQVKEFGSMMVRDHSKANDELKQLAASKNVTLPQTIGEDHQKHIADLQKKTGRDFDKAYISLMTDDHKDDVDAFEKAANNAKDADIKAFASKTLPTLRSHLDSARAIKDRVKG